MPKKGDTIQFTNYSIDATSYLWDFGNGDTSTEMNPCYAFATSGSKIITLSATNEFGTDTVFKEVFINDLIIMSYNICLAGGAIPLVLEIDSAARQGLVDTLFAKNRIHEICSIIRAIDPDILGLQEALLWDSFDPPYYQSFADSIRMKYYYYPEYEEAEWNGICIYSKFPIESTGLVLHQPCIPDRIWNGTCMLKATARLDEHKSIDIITCHLITGNEEIWERQVCEVEAISNYIKSDFNPNTILMGDMNFALIDNGFTLIDGLSQNEYKAKSLKEAGLFNINSQNETQRQINIDQVWITESIAKEYLIFEYPMLSNIYPELRENNIESLFNPEIRQLLFEASDHKPIVAYFAFE